MNDDQFLVEMAILAAANLIADADALLITSGAGMGIDSGLPDFRGENGFWNACPALGNLGISFTQIANTKAFRQHAELAKGFYAHRLQIYRNTVPDAHLADSKKNQPYILVMRIANRYYLNAITQMGFNLIAKENIWTRMLFSPAST